MLPLLANNGNKIQNWDNKLRIFWKQSLAKISGQLEIWQGNSHSATFPKITEIKKG